MSVEQIADANKNQDAGNPDVESSSATTEQSPNTPDTNALSGVEQQEPEQQANAEGAEATPPEAAEPEASSEGEPSQEPANDKQQYKKKTGERIQTILQKNKDVESQLKAYREKFGALPDFQGQAQNAQAQSQTTTQPAPLPVGQAQPDPLEQTIASKSAAIQNMFQQWNSVDDQAAKDAIAMQYNAALREVESLKEQRITQRVMQSLQQQQAQTQRFSVFMGEAAEVNATLPNEAKFLDAGGRVNMASPGFQAMAAQAWSHFNMPPQALAQSPEVLAYCANSMARRFNGAVAGATAFTKKQIINKQKSTAIKVGVESGGEPASAPVGGKSAERARLEKLVKESPDFRVRKQATLKLMAMAA